MTAGLAMAPAVAAADDFVPETQRRIRIGMPQLDASGLSENWLFRHAGDLHWQATCARLQAASDQIESDWGQRLYPTFLAVRARYDQPLARVRENDRFEASAEIVPCGSACAQGRVRARAGAVNLELELLSTFARREGGGLRRGLPAARLAARWGPVQADPGIARLARSARRGEPLADGFCGPPLASRRPALGQLIYEPSPYADYNGAGLLYFASYVTIADTAERMLVKQLGLSPAQGAGAVVDWALQTSVVRRDVFYYRNLPLGEGVSVELRALEHEPGRATVKTHVCLRRQATGELMADLVTRRQLRTGG